MNNAGIALDPHLTWENDWDDLDRLISVNVKGILKMIQLFVPDMISRERGHIINVGSIAGKYSFEGRSAYSGTKHMVHAINTTLRLELVSTPIRVSLVIPGVVETELYITQHKTKEEEERQKKEGIKPLIGENIADSIVYIASR